MGYLTVQRNLLYYNVRDFEAQGNGTNDDTTPIANAIAAASAAGGGVVFFPAGTYISTTQTLLSNVFLYGAGPSATIIKLKNTTNADLFSAQTSSINLSAASASGIVGTLSSFGILSMTLDGNKANQASGPSYPLRCYGYQFILRDLEIKNGFSGGALLDWNGSLPSGMEAFIDNLRVHDNNAIGWQMGGPHDSQLEHIFVYNNGSHNFHFAPNANGIQVANSHAYLPPATAGSCNYLIEVPNGSNFINCISDGGQNTGVAIIGASVAWQGEIYTSVAGNVGVQLGQQAGQTPFPGQIKQAAGVTTAVQAAGSLLVANINGCTGGSIKANNEITGFYLANISQGSGAVFPGSAFDATDQYILNVTGQANQSISQITGLSLTGAHMALNAAINTAIAALIQTGADNHKGVVIVANSGSQSVNLFEIQNSGFVIELGIDKGGNLTTLGNIVGIKFGGGSAGGVNATIEFLIGVEADANTGLLVYAHSTTQSAPLLALQNSVFSTVYSVDKGGNVTASGSRQLGGASTLFSGTGAPAGGLGANGDFYFRQDGGAVSHIYFKSAGAWSGLI